MGIKTTGLSSVNRKLTKLTRINKGIMPTMRNIEQHGKDVVGLYPPKPTRSKYVRTGDYGRSVGGQTKSTSTGVQTLIFSRGLSYAQWLKNPQARHMGHWKHISLDAVRIGRYAISQVRNYVSRLVR